MNNMNSQTKSSIDILKRNNPLENIKSTERYKLKILPDKEREIDISIKKKKINLQIIK